MKANFLSIGLLLSSAAMAADGSLSVEQANLRNSTSQFFKVVDTQEKRVCYIANTATGGGVTMSCYDAKADSPDRVNPESVAKD